MTNEVAKPKTVDESIIDHLRENFGKLMTEEQLTIIFEKSIDHLLFQQQTKTVGSGYNVRTVNVGSLIEKSIKELISPMVDKHVKNLVAENQDKIMELIASNMGTPEQMAASVFGGLFSKISNQIQSDVLMSLQNNQNDY